MPQSIFIFDFGTNEEAAQQARHKVEAWQQGFRLGKKMLIKFEREHADASGEAAEAESSPAEKPKPASKKSASAKGARAAETSDGDAGKVGAEKDESISRVRVLISLDFSDHEKLTLQRWLDRIPAEEPFKSAKSEAIRPGNPDFAKTVELFDSLK